MAADLRDRGYAVWNLEYRRIGHPGGGYPGTFRDIAAGVDHLRTIAAPHSLDLRRVALAGHSAGGHLALWAAARDRLPAESPLRTARPLPIRGVVSLAGIADLDAYRQTGPDACGGPSTIDDLVGVQEPGGRNVLADTSPPVLLPLGDRQVVISGALDAIVPPLLAEFGPDVVISQHGCDGHHADPLGHMNLSIDGQTAMAQRIHQWVHKFTKGKWVVTGGGGYAIVDVVPRAWTQLIAEVCGHGLSTDTELPARWRSETEALTGITAPATAGENVACSTYSWGSDRRAEDATDQAIAQTRQAVFPHFGLDPDSAQ